MNKKITFLLFAAVLFTVQLVNAQQYIISPFAGIGGAGYSGDGGPATAAQLSGPTGIVVDDSGNVIYCDQTCNRVRKIDTKGIITTIAGSGSGLFSGDGGPATNAGIFNPLGLALDNKGNIFIADWGDSRIRKVDKNGIITTVAGNGTLGFNGDGGPATDAILDYPYGVGVDSIGNIYICDSGNDRLRKVDTNGTITTIAGIGVPFQNSGDGGLAINAGVNFPTWVWLDHKGNIYVANAPVVRKINTGDTITTVIGNYTFNHTGDGGLATNAGIGFMEGGGAFDDSMNFYFCEFYHEYVRKVYANDSITTIAGDGIQNFAVPYGNADSARMSFPYGTACDHHGNIYFCDNGNQKIRKLSPCSKIVTFATVPKTICAGFSDTISITSANTYSWIPSVNVILDSTGLNVIASPAVTTTYTITGTTCFATATVVVTVDTVPVVTVSPSSPSACQGSGVTLVASGADTYQWSPSTDLNATTGDSVVSTPAAAITYTVTGTGNGCKSQSIEVDVASIPVPNKPTITKSVTGNSLISSATQGNQWYLNDTLISGATDQTLETNGQTGSYTVTVVNPANGCSSSSDATVISGLEQLSANTNQLSVYPNPTKGVITISSSENIDEIRITNLLGQTLLKSPLLRGDLGVCHKFTFELKDEGMYFIKVTSGNETVTQKIVVSK